MEKGNVAVTVLVLKETESKSTDEHRFTKERQIRTFGKYWREWESEVELRRKMKENVQSIGVRVT